MTLGLTEADCQSGEAGTGSAFGPHFLSGVAASLDGNASALIVFGGTPVKPSLTALANYKGPS